MVSQKVSSVLTQLLSGIFQGLDVEVPSLPAQLAALQLLLVDLSNTQEVEERHGHRDEVVQEALPTVARGARKAQPHARQGCAGES